MNLVVPINGRDAIPVRAICYGYGFSIISPDKVATAAAGEDHYDGSWTLPTYYLSEGDVVEQMRPQDWNLYSQRIQSESLLLLDEESRAGAKKAEWRNRAIALMPAGVFVWVDELRQWLRRTLPMTVKKAHLLLAYPEGDEQHDAAVKAVVESMERPWDVVGDGLSLKIQISRAEANIVMEGFPQASAPTTAPAPELPACADSEPVQEDAHQEESDVSTGGLVAWQAAMIESWREIMAAHKGRPKARDAMLWLKKHGPRDVFPVEQPDHQALRWIDRDGNTHSAAYRSIASRISEWKKAGKIPA